MQKCNVVKLMVMLPSSKAIVPQMKICFDGLDPKGGCRCACHAAALIAAHPRYHM